MSALKVKRDIKSFAEAELLYNSQLADQFNPNFFSRFQRVTVENLRTTSRTQNSISFIGQKLIFG